jgi:hypothetical protein
MEDALSNFRRTGKAIEKAMGGPTLLGPRNGGKRIGGSGLKVGGYVDVPPGIRDAVRKGVRIDARVKRRGKDEWDVSTEIYGRAHSKKKGRRRIW